MAAHEQHEQAVVLIGDLNRVVLQRGLSLPVSAGAFASPLVDEATRGSLEEPAARLGRNSVPRPALGGHDQRLLDGVLGGIEVAISPGEGAEDLRRQLAQQVFGTELRGQLLPPAACR